MSVATFKIGKAEFVIVPRRRYERLTRADQDRRDAVIACKARVALKASKLKTVPLSAARHTWTCERMA